jgi:excisionase family DNA binding protein
MATYLSAWTGEKPRKATNGVRRGSAALNRHVSLAWDGYSALFTKQQAADYIQCTPRYLERQIRAGRLRALKPSGKLVRIRRADLEEFLESGSTIRSEQ